MSSGDGHVSQVHGCSVMVGMWLPPSVSSISAMELSFRLFLAFPLVQVAIFFRVDERDVGAALYVRGGPLFRSGGC